jgi:uncharacterized protein (TIGR03118 family)
LSSFLKADFMKKIINSSHPSAGRVTSLLFILLLLTSTGCDKLFDELEDHFRKKKGKAEHLKGFYQVNLVASNQSFGASRVDANLVNGWGIAFSPTGVPWVNSTGKGLSLIFNAEGAQVREPVAVPSPTATTGGLPTGIVFSGTSDFALPNGQPARFIFCGVDGIISGWNAGTGSLAPRVVNQSATSAFTGLALANDGGANFLYAADFRAGKIAVFDRSFAPVEGKPFVDPTLPAGYAPFNIQNVQGNLYVLYAKVGPDGRDEPGVGNGYVSIFGTDGKFIRRFASRGHLNAPWGVAFAPAAFFEDGNNSAGAETAQDAILVGNFGDGRIHAYDLDGKFLGPLEAGGTAVVIDGLWAITFPPATATSVDPNRLYFAAGPDHEQQGLFGYITK